MAFPEDAAGLSAIIGAKAVGAWPFIAINRVASKPELATRCGATHIVNAGETDPIAAVRDLTRRGGRTVAMSMK